MLAMINSNNAEQSTSTEVNQQVWTVQYKPNNDSQPWSELRSCDGKAGALLYAAKVSEEYFLVKVLDPGGSVIWSN